MANFPTKSSLVTNPAAGDYSKIRYQITEIQHRIHPLAEPGDHRHADLTLFWNVSRGVAVRTLISDYSPMGKGINIHTVGHHLQKEAVSASLEKRDAYARSAFNRYYYSAFLNTRSLLESLDPEWSSLSHSSYPEVLKGKVRKKLNRESQRAQKNGDGTLVMRLETAKRAVNELAKIMTTAYAVRVVADYEPDEQVSFGGNLRFSLRSVDISDAHEWETGTRLLCLSVFDVWDEIRE